jgi:hypothetical protein
MLGRLKLEKKEEGITHHGSGDAGAPSGLRSPRELGIFVEAAGRFDELRRRR